MKLRTYQQEAVSAALYSLNRGNNPVVSLPTGSGKSLVAAAICAQRPGRTLVLSHRKELLIQDQEALYRYAPEIDSGIYSAGLGRRDTHQRVIFGGVASVYKKLPELQLTGQFETVLIDEAHLVAPMGEGIMYRTCLDSLPLAGLCGLTATPYRLDSGKLHEGEGAWFDDLCIHIKPSELIPEYLSPLVGVGSNAVIDTSGVKIRQGDFIVSELSESACDNDLIKRTVQEMISLSAGRNHILVFCIDIDHANAILDGLSSKGEIPKIVTGQTAANERADILQEFKKGNLRWLINVGVLTTGFDAPLVDCIAMIRPTMSKSLYVQIMGRGMRKAEGKTDCIVLDFAGNIQRHGSLDMLQKYRESDREKKAAEKKRRNESERERREKEYRHDTTSSGGTLFGDDDEPFLEEKRVIDMGFYWEYSRKYQDKKNIVVNYRLDDNSMVKQWLCVQYPGYGSWPAQKWFKRRGLIMPTDPDAAIELARKSKRPVSVSVTFDGRYQNLKTEHFPVVEEKTEVAEFA